MGRHTLHNRHGKDLNPSPSQHGRRKIPRSPRRRLAHLGLASSQQESPDHWRRRAQVAAGRILNLLNADAKVTVVSPRDGLNDEVAYRIEQKQVEYHDKKFDPTDLDDPAITMVL